MLDESVALQVHLVVKEAREAITDWNKYKVVCTCAFCLGARFGDEHHSLFVGTEIAGPNTLLTGNGMDP